MKLFRLIVFFKYFLKQSFVYTHASYEELFNDEDEAEKALCSFWKSVRNPTHAFYFCIDDDYWSDCLDFSF
jgi:hypothetical protein